jgi:hypothetical protein
LDTFESLGNKKFVQNIIDFNSSRTEKRMGNYNWVFGKQFVKTTGFKNSQSHFVVCVDIAALNLHIMLSER